MMRRQKQLELTEIRCQKCRCFLVATLTGSKAFCPRCRVWSTAVSDGLGVDESDLLGVLEE